MVTEEKRAIIIGSTGLTGSFLLDLLLKSDAYHKILATVRNPSTSKNIKLKYIETDFKKLDQVSAELMADCIFICIGSTMAKSGSKGAFLKVDYDIPVDLAHIAIKNGVKKCVVISSLGANANSGNFYLQTKGKMEQAIEKLGFETTIFLRPSLLLGARKEMRFGELAGKLLMKFFSPLLIGSLKRYRGIHASTVAKAMLKLSLDNLNGVHKIESDQIEAIASQYS